MTTPSAAPPAAAFQGNDRLLFGMIAGLVTFWLFAQTMLNVDVEAGRKILRLLDALDEAARLAATQPELEGCGMHDPLAVAAALDPTLVTTLGMNLHYFVTDNWAVEGVLPTFYAASGLALETGHGLLAWTLEQARR